MDFSPDYSVWESEDAKHASELVKRIYRDENIYIYQKYAESLFKRLKYVPNF